MSSSKKPRQDARTESLEVEWKAPPPRNRSKSYVTRTIAILKTRPGHSARVVTNARSTSATATWRKHGCRAQIRQAEAKADLYDVYAWWPDPENPDAPPVGPED